MTDERSDRTEHPPWPLRAALLLGCGIVCGLLFDLLTRDRAAADDWAWTESVGRIALAIAVAAGFALLALTLERARWRWSLAFAAAGGLVIGGIYFWNGTPEQHGADDALRFLTSLLSVAIAAPLFQTMRDEGARRLPYPAVHAHAWTNVVLWCAAWAFVLASFLLALLLGQLFDLIGIDLLKEALGESWFVWMLIGGAFGGAAGLLRDRDKVLGLLQRVVTTVLSVLAPVLAAGLVLFVLALPFTGLDVLWEKTSTPTPVVLACVSGAIVLANAVIGNAAAEEARGRVLRWSAMALGAVMAPLVAVAAISTGLRIGQYGFTPSRLWGVVAVAVAAGYALAYLYALVRGRANWGDRVRPLNITLAIGVCILALVLATPLALFGQISARSQLARLESGAVSPAEFDWRAMRFEFGRSGVAALERLKAAGASPEVRRLAETALGAEAPYDLASAEDRRLASRQVLRVLPQGARIPPGLREIALRGRRCADDRACLLIVDAAGNSAVLVNSDYCGGGPSGTNSCEPMVGAYYLRGAQWENLPPRPPGGESGAVRHDRLEAALRQGRVEIREVPRRQVFIDGTAVGDAFE